MSSFRKVLFVAIALEATTVFAEETVNVRGTRSTTETSFNDDSIRTPTDLASLVDAQPGVVVRHLGSEGSFATISVRGSTPSQVSVYYEGVPLTGGGDPAFDIGTFPLLADSTVTLYRGFAPIALGGTHLGGVLSIRAPNAVSGSSTRWWMASGSFNSMKARWSNRFKSGDVELATGASVSRSEGDFTYTLFDPVTHHFTTHERANNRYVSASLVENANLKTDFGEIGGFALWSSRAQGVPGSIDFQNNYTNLSGQLFVAGVRANVDAGAFGLLQSRWWVRREENMLMDPKGEVSLVGVASETSQTTQSFGTSALWLYEPHENLDLQIQLSGRSERFDDAANPARRIAADVAGQVEWSHASTGSAVLAGRMEGYRDDAINVSNNNFVLQTGSVTVLLQMFPWLSATGRTGILARPASFLERYGNTGTLLGNADIQPEKSWLTDLGFQMHLSDQSTKAAIFVTGFYTRAEDLITYVPIGRGTFRADNIDAANMVGLEVSGQLKHDRVDTSLTYTLLKTSNESGRPLVQDKPLPGRPVHDLFYDVQYSVADFIYVHYGMDMSSETTLDEAATIVLPTRLLHRAGVKFRKEGRYCWEAGVEVENLLDTRIGYVNSPLSGGTLGLPMSDYLGFPLPGRTVWVSLSFATR